MWRVRIALAAAASISMTGVSPCLSQTAKQVLVAPFEEQRTQPPNPDAARLPCGAPPPPQRDIDKKPFYSDNAQSVTDPRKWQDMWRETAPLRAFATSLATMSDAYRADTSRNRSRAQCVASWLDAWAQGGALLGEVTLWGRWDAVWFTQISAGLSYLKIRRDPSLDAGQRDRIERWLGAVAREVLKADMSLRWRHRHPTNLRYWAGAAAAVAGIAGNDRQLAEEGFATARAGLESVDGEGALPAELRRRGKAFQYHVWALEPLVLTTVLAATNGVDLTAVNDRALSRVIAFVASQRLDSSRIVALSGASQEGDLSAWPKFPGDLAFAEMARGLVGATALDDVLAKHRPIVNMRVGGDITKLFGPGRRAMP
jgi:poly(beta-D-mannuronate) lyase